MWNLRHEGISDTYLDFLLCGKVSTKSWVIQGPTVIHRVWGQCCICQAPASLMPHPAVVLQHSTLCVPFSILFLLIFSLPLSLSFSYFTPFFSLPVFSSPDHTGYLPEAPGASADLWSTLLQCFAWSRYKYPGIPHWWCMKSFTLLYSCIFPLQARWEFIKTQEEFESSFEVSQHALSTRANARWRCYSLLRRFQDKSHIPLLPLQIFSIKHISYWQRPLVKTH